MIAVVRPLADDISKVIKCRDEISSDLNIKGWDPPPAIFRGAAINKKRPKPGHKGSTKPAGQ